MAAGPPASAKAFATRAGRAGDSAMRYLSDSIRAGQGTHGNEDLWIYVTIGCALVAVLAVIVRLFIGLTGGDDDR